jgi:hypothetical protein
LDFPAGRDDRHADHPGDIIVNPMPETAALATVPRRFAFDTRTDAWGYLSGGVLALGASLSFAAARAGVINGLTPGYLIPMWFGVAGIVLLPLLRWDFPTLAAIGRRRGLVLTGRGGPPSRSCKWAATLRILAYGAAIPPARVTIQAQVSRKPCLGSASVASTCSGRGPVILAEITS